MLTGGIREGDDVVLDEGVDVDLLDGLLQLKDLVLVGDLLNRLNGVGNLLAIEDEDLIGWPAVHVDVDFLSPLRFGDVFEVDVVSDRTTEIPVDIPKTHCGMPNSASARITHSVLRPFER